MSRRIQILPDSVANQIAAGEVVERPASVVKELVENALDAGASHIQVTLEGGGKQRIRVADDGVGMGREDALLSLERHATSKISQASDLVSVGTFGFRGEALPSIAAVTRVVLETRAADEETGTQIRVDGGRILSVKDLARQAGTTVDARSLFFNAPARRKFLKAAPAETRAVSEALGALALAHPSVAFTLSSGDRALLSLLPASNLASRIGELWGADGANTLVSLAPGPSGPVSIRGLIQRPDATRPGFRRAYLFVNGRPFRDPKLLRAADRGYRTTIPSGHRPWLFLYFTVEPGTVDVNVHPAKLEVRFKDPPAVERLVEEAVQRVLAEAGSGATLDTEIAPPRLQVREPGRRVRSGDRAGEHGHRVGLVDGDLEPVGAPRREKGFGTPTRKGKSSESQMALFLPREAEDLDGLAETLKKARPEGLQESQEPRLWQVHDMYILAETREGLLIIDQHSAHERVLFQQLMGAFQEAGLESQRLLFPLTLRLAPAEARVVRELHGILARAGFEVEDFGGDTVIVQAVPNPHPYFDAERCLREMIAELTEGSELVRSGKNQHERIAKTFACKGAIKAGQRLSHQELAELFDALFSTDLPFHDVHGRPTIVRLSKGELERKFGR